MTRTLELLDRLIAFPTLSRQSNLALIDWAQALLTGAGFHVTRIPAPGGKRAGLFATIGPSVTGGICLSAHTDVVPVEGQNWTHEPFTMTHAGDRVIGRGTTDMKGFVASALALAERAQNVTLTQPLSLVLSYDEEIGCVGIAEMMPALAPLLGKPRLVIVGEPTSMQIATGHKGKAALKVTCTGEAGHSALAPNFANAIHIAAQFVQEIRALQDSLMSGPRDAAYDIPYSTVHVGTIEGGRALNIVPDLATLNMEFRHLAEAAPETLHRAIAAAAKRAGAAFDRPDAVSIETVNAYPGLNQSSDAAAIGWAQKNLAQGPLTKVPFGTEAGFFAEFGLDAIVLGPGDMQTDGHKPDEAITLAQLAACDAMMDRVLQALAA